jgi:tRNA modification GTPase
MKLCVTQWLKDFSVAYFIEIPSCLVTADMRQAIHYLVEITGQIATNEILGAIFRNLCIGK